MSANLKETAANSYNYRLCKLKDQWAAICEPRVPSSAYYDAVLDNIRSQCESLLAKWFTKEGERIRPHSLSFLQQSRVYFHGAEMILSQHHNPDSTSQKSISVFGVRSTFCSSSSGIILRMRHTTSPG
jgi:hypothetical protein